MLRFNPLWILRNNRTVEVIKATKSVIGGFTTRETNFDSHKIQFKRGSDLPIYRWLC